MSDLISVIIPVYNSEAVLESCLSSLFSQTYTNFEIILIDDGSSDASLKICEKYAKEYSNVFALRQAENKGPSSARNLGIEASHGDYIAFVDSDDQIAPQYLETLLTNIKNSGADISAVSYQIVKRGKQPKQNKDNKTLSFSSNEAIADLLYQNRLDSSQCCKLYRKSVIEKIRFDERISVYEDLLFVYQAFCNCNKIVWSDQKLYYYFKQDNGQMDRVSPMTLDAFEVMEQIKSDIAQRNPLLLGAIENRTISVSFNILKLLARSKRHNKDIEDICWSNIKALRKSNFFDHNVRIKNKLGIIVSLLGNALSRKILSINI